MSHGGMELHTALFDAELLLHLFIAYMGVSYVYYCWRTKVPIFPTQPAARAIIVAEVRAEALTKAGKKLKIVDLGSGTGGLCRAVARAVPSAQITGYEIAWPAWLFAVLAGRWAGLHNLRFKCSNFWLDDISDADIVLCYLGIVVMPTLSEKLRRDRQAGRLIISNTFPLPDDWQPFRRIAVPASLSKQILLYRQE